MTIDYSLLTVDYPFSLTVDGFGVKVLVLDPVVVILVNPAVQPVGIWVKARLSGSGWGEGRAGVSDGGMVRVRAGIREGGGGKCYF